MDLRIPRLPKSVNSATCRRWARGALLAFGLGGCAPLVEKAPFPGRPDTLVSGDLLGPFDGVVLDAETDRAIAGALVVGSWAFERGIGLQGPAGTQEVTTETGVDGRYRLPALRDLPSGRSMRVRRFTLIVYHRGHVGWRSDRRFPDGDARHDFSQRGNRVRLEKWRPDFRHAAHLVFLGGGAQVRTAAAWEAQPASLELEGITGVPVASTAAEERAAAALRLDASALLSEDEVRGVTGYAGPFEIRRLSDLPQTEFYDSRHFKAQGKPERYDVALRVWRLGSAAAEAQFGKLQGELPGAERRDEIGDSSFRAHTPDVLGLVFLNRERGIVVSVTCGVAQCTDVGMLLRMGKLVESHLGDLPTPPSGPATPAAPAPSPTPATPAPAEEKTP